MSRIDVFNPEEGAASFDDFSKQNGIVYWHAKDFMAMLGYDDYDIFRKVIEKATSACIAAGIPYEENIIHDSINGDFRLTRFACFLIAMNGDPKKERVAKAQVFFAELADKIADELKNAENIDRIVIRGDVSQKEKALSHTAFKHGVTSYPLFQNAGYMGMYNMHLTRLKSYKGFRGKESLLDYMGKDELAANLFRITQTEAKIRNENIVGQVALERTAKSAGKTVRDAMIAISGRKPEDLPLETRISEVKSGLKKVNSEFKKRDKKKLPK